MQEAKGTKRRTRRSDPEFPLEKGVDLGGRRVRSKLSRHEGHAASGPGVGTDSPPSRESEDDDDFGNFKVAVG